MISDAEQLAVWRAELLRYVHRLTGDPDLAEDVAQDALLRLHATRSQEAHGGPVCTPVGPVQLHNSRAWLYRVATNLVRDAARRMETTQRHAVAIDPQGPATPDEELERSEAIARVRAALDRLRPRDRELLMLRESGFRYREIAEVIGVREQSLPTLAARALRRFRAAYLGEVRDEAS